MPSPFQLFTFWSFRRELLYVTLAFSVILLLPVVAVFVLVNTGINVISDSLVSSDPETQTVSILDPRDGSSVKEVTAAYMWPIRGAITLEFSESSLYQVFHTGLDISTKKGTPIVAFMDGEVTYAGEIFWGYGKHVIIDHGDNLSTVYAHLDKILVYKGQPVKMGDVIGNEGNTGWSTGAHLHFEIRVYGLAVNPRVFLATED